VSQTTMKSFNPYILSSLVLREKKCLFSRSCKLYSNASYTCTHVGGEYCGKYRALLHISEKEKDLTQNYIVERTISA